MKKSKIVSPYASYIDPNEFGEPDLSRLLIFDTTLRDGEQSPGAAQGPEEKAHLAGYIATLNVDAMEVSFGESDPEEIKATRQVIRALNQSEDQYRKEGEKDIVIYSLSKALPASVNEAWKAVQSARLPGLHTVIATSDKQIEVKFPGKTWRDIKEVLVDETVHMAELISSSGKYGMVEVSAEDATRTPIERLVEIYSSVMDVIKPYQGKVGFTFNIPDTVGVVVFPETYGKLFSGLRAGIRGIDSVILSTHAHNDHGLAVTNSLYAILNGARQVEVAVNGMGERAGNASLEQIAMILAHDEQHHWGINSEINTQNIFPVSVEVAAFTGYHPARNQPVVGSNAAQHEAGIHQDGVIKGMRKGETHTYEGVTPKEIGAPASRIPLGRRSGANAVQYHLELMGYTLKTAEDGRWDTEERNQVYAQYIAHAQNVRTVTHVELRDNVMSKVEIEKDKPLPLEYITHTRFYDPEKPENPEGAKVLLRIDENEPQEYIGYGRGELESVFDAMRLALGNMIELKDYNQHNISTMGREGIRSIARTEIVLKDTVAGGLYICEGYDLDIGISAAKAIASGWNLKLMEERVRK